MDRQKTYQSSDEAEYLPPKKQTNKQTSKQRKKERKKERKKARLSSLAPKKERQSFHGRTRQKM